MLTLACKLSVSTCNVIGCHRDVALAVSPNVNYQCYFHLLKYPNSHKVFSVSCDLKQYNAVIDTISFANMKWLGS